MKGPCRSHKGGEAATLWCHCTYGGVRFQEDEIRSVEGPDARSLTQDPKEKLDTSHD